MTKLFYVTFALVEGTSLLIVIIGGLANIL